MVSASQVSALPSGCNPLGLCRLLAQIIRARAKWKIVTPTVLCIEKKFELMGQLFERLISHVICNNPQGDDYDDHQGVQPVGGLATEP
jgi:hypothetical protein